MNARERARRVWRVVRVGGPVCDSADEALQAIKLVVLKTFLSGSPLKNVIHAVKRWRVVLI